ncbi:MAG: rubrerythrin [Bacteroidales bacterium]
MEISIKGTQTEKNLLKAFAGESQARMRYTLFAKRAVKEGYEQIAALFRETAEQEAVHASRFFSYLEGGMVEITASYPAGKVGSTAENLKEAAAGENEEWTELYPEFARVAAEEGFKKISSLFKIIAEAEITHEKRYLKLLRSLENSSVFEKEEKVDWYCRKCGYVYKGRKAPKNCPACEHPQGYFELMGENY